ncbi:MAG: lytic transglycosylase [Marmoricola sp.]|nr:lytic transglycosylase [Marmoricola sp.]
MTVGTVTSRIQELQTQLALLSPVSTSSLTAADGTTFAQALDSASSTTGGTTGAAVVDEAKQFLGLPYVWGGNSKEKGVDCSGLVQQVYKKFGIELPRLSADQARQGTPVASLAQAKPGDLLAWDNSSRNSGADHIAIYVGNGKMIEAPRTGLDVRLVDVPSTPDYIRRILPDSAPGGVTPVSTARVAGGSVSGVPYADLFNQAGARYGVSPALLSAVAKQESGYRADAVSPAGARGLMQLMPGTAKGLGVTNSLDPTQAVDGAARMLRDLTHRFGSTELALAAYNAGPGAVMKYDGIPPYAETQHYVRNIMSMLGRAA